MNVGLLFSLEDACSEFVRREQIVLNSSHSIKTYGTLVVDLIEYTNAGEDDGINGEEMQQVTQRFYIYFQTKTISSVDTDLKQWFIGNIIQISNVQLEEFLTIGSGWTLQSIISLDIHNNSYNPLRGISFIKLSSRLQNKKCLINVRNSDNKCFLYAVLSNFKKHAEKVSKYIPFLNSLDLTGIRFPMQVKNIKKFEKNNQRISINVYIERNEKIEVLRLTDKVKEKHIHLLLMQEEVNTLDSADMDISYENNEGIDSFVSVKSHYVWVKNLSRLLSEQCSKQNNRIFSCDRCLMYFHNEEKLESHLNDCILLNECAVQMPTEGNHILEFKNYQHQLETPFVIYADTEAILKRVIENDIEDQFCAGNNTQTYQKHIPFAVGLYFKCAYAYDDSLSY